MQGEKCLGILHTCSPLKASGSGSLANMCQEWAVQRIHSGYEWSDKYDCGEQSAWNADDYPLLMYFE